jgi:hypothetical protein
MVFSPKGACCAVIPTFAFVKNIQKTKKTTALSDGCGLDEIIADFNLVQSLKKTFAKLKAV